MKFFTSLRIFFTSLFALLMSIVFLPFQLSLPTLPPRRRSSRDRQFRVGTRSSLRLKGLPAEKSELVVRKRCLRKRRVADDSTFSDDDDENDETFEVANFEPEPVLQRGLNWCQLPILLNFFLLHFRSSTQ